MVHASPSVDSPFCWCIFSLLVVCPSRGGPFPVVLFAFRRWLFFLVGRFSLKTPTNKVPRSYTDSYCHVYYIDGYSLSTDRSLRRASDGIIFIYSYMQV